MSDFNQDLRNVSKSIFMFLSSKDWDIVSSRNSYTLILRAKSSDTIINFFELEKLKPFFDKHNYNDEFSIKYKNELLEIHIGHELPF